MAFIPVVEQKTFGKRAIPQLGHPSMLAHSELATNVLSHTGKRVTGFPKPFRLDDDLSLRPRRDIDNADIFKDPRAVEQPKKRSHTSMEGKVEYAPLDAKVTHEAAVFATAAPTVHFHYSPRGEHPKPGLRLAPLPQRPPPQNEVPGFRGMGNPVLIVPNPRPNQAAAVKTNALKGLEFHDNRKNNIWSVYQEP